MAGLSQFVLPDKGSAKKKIDELVLKDLAVDQKAKFRVLMLGNAAGIKKTDAAIEDLFDDQFYIDCGNAAFGILIKELELPVDGSDMITKRVEEVLVRRYGHKELDKRRVTSEILRRFDEWKKLDDLPKGLPKKRRSCSQQSIMRSRGHPSEAERARARLRAPYTIHPNSRALSFAAVQASARNWERQRWPSFWCSSRVEGVRHELCFAHVRVSQLEARARHRDDDLVARHLGNDLWSPEPRQGHRVLPYRIPLARAFAIAAWKA